MTIQCYVGRFNAPSATGNQTYSGIVDASGAAFTPQVTIFFSNRIALGAGSSPVTGTAAQSIMQGWAISAGSQVVTECVDIPGGAIGAYADTSLCVYNAFLGGGTSKAVFVSSASGSITVNWTGIFAVIKPTIHYLAIAGLNSVAITQFLSPAATGSSPVTGVGFSPNGLMLMGAESTVGPPGNNANTYFHGFADDNLIQESLSGNVNDGGASGNRSRWQLSNRAILGVGNNEALDLKAQLTSYDSDGFTCNYETNTVGQVYMWALCFKTNYPDAIRTGIFQQPAATGSLAVNIPGFVPVGLIIEGDGNVANTAATDDCVAFWGMSDGTRMGARGSSSLTGTNNIDIIADPTKIITLVNSSTAVVYNASLTSFDSNPAGFTLNVTTTDGTARESIYFAFGSNYSRQLTLTGVGS